MQRRLSWPEPRPRFNRDLLADQARRLGGTARWVDDCTVILDGPESVVTELGDRLEQAIVARIMEMRERAARGATVGVP